MRGRVPALRFVLYAAPAVIAAAGPSWALSLSVGAIVGVAGLGLERRLRVSFDGEVAFLATLALLTSVVVTGTANAPDPGHVLLFAASCLAFIWLTAERAPGIARLALASVLGISPAAFDLIGASWWQVHPMNLLVSVFGALGLLYGAPLMWAGFVGLFGLRYERPGLARLAFAVLGSGTLGLLLATDRVDRSTRIMTWLPFLLPGVAHCFQKARDFAARRPERILAVAGALLVLWNVLFMEQYRRRLLPSDETVSFAQVTSNSSALLSSFVGTPSAWPANWIFAKRFGAPVDRWDALAGRNLFTTTDAAQATVEIGDDPSVFAADRALLLEGFGMRRTCEQGWCRDLDGEGRLLLPLSLPHIGTGDLAVRLRARGQGALSLSLNGAATSVSEMSESLADVSLRVPARLLRPGVSILSLRVVGGGKATVDRLTLERDP